MPSPPGRVAYLTPVRPSPRDGTQPVGPEASSSPPPFARRISPFSPPRSVLAVLPSLRADEEVSDPKALLEERAKAKCVSQWYEYQKCVKRIENDETGHKHCTGQYFDYWKCVDKSVAEKLFDLLK
ncbi:hypothetical protein C2845_PM11G07260 [Panicum miliaceum]|uniref:Complex III subunit VI n=1 Tax=Panicum miliaceum TaxID=4540 RepID=A0A3L6RTW8_PANMI|nr:hypothetical protein C2845_PM11G07260 [Panicum miliaceum]